MKAKSWTRRMTLIGNRRNEGDLNDNNNPGEGKWLILNSYERTCEMPQTEHYKINFHVD